MKALRHVAIFVFALIMVLTSVMFIAACGENCGKDYPKQIVNGGFEENPDSSTWKGWTRDGSAFSARGVIAEDSVNGVKVDKTGDKFFSGLDGGTQKMTGTLTSDVFELAGTGFIAFKMGAAKNADKIYVEFFEEGNQVALAKETNTDFDGTWITDHLIRRIVDLSANVGKKLYIKITDNDNTDDFGYVNLDDFVVCMTDADVAAYRRERERQLAEYGEPYFEEDETQTTIINGGFETGDLTGWKVLSGTAFTKNGVVSTSQRYWTDRAVYGNGDYYFDGNNNGATAESMVGAIRSTKFTLAGDGYITFMIGAGAGNCYVAICDGATDAELIKVTNRYFNDPKLALTLLRYYVDASEYKGRVLYVKVVDNNGGSGFAFINVDDVRVSMTEAEVKALQVEQYNAIANETYTSASYNDLVSLKDYYANYEYLFVLDVLKFVNTAKDVVVASNDNVNLNVYISDVKAVKGTEEVSEIAITKVNFGEQEYTEGFDAFDLSAEGTYTITYVAVYGEEQIQSTFTVVVKIGEHQVVNGGFETGDLTGWTILTEGWGVTNGKYDGVISAATYWGEELPYNQSGNYHLDGWNTGIGEADGWAIRSSEFVLGGSGFITVKMGGNAAAVKVYKADGTPIGYYKQTRFNDNNFPNVGDGNGSWADMAVYAIDLTGYIGETLYVELHDEVISAGWAHAWFDDVITYYETAPDYANLYDEVINGGENKITVRISWVLAENLLSD